MLPVAIAMLGSHARAPTLGFLGWFGPRGLASIVFAVIVIEESNLPHEHLIVLAIYLTVGLSVLAHGLTAAPLADRYARWYEQHPRDSRAADGERPGRGDASARTAAHSSDVAITRRLHPDPGDDRSPGAGSASSRRQCDRSIRKEAACPTDPFSVRRHL